MNEWCLSLSFQECSDTPIRGALTATSRHTTLRRSCFHNATFSCIPILSWRRRVYVPSICTMFFGGLHAWLQWYRNSGTPIGFLGLEFHEMNHLGTSCIICFLL